MSKEFTQYNWFCDVKEDEQRVEVRKINRIRSTYEQAELRERHIAEHFASKRGYKILSMQFDFAEGLISLVVKLEKDNPCSAVHS